MNAVTQSQFAMYKTLVALVWADGKLEPQERERVQFYIDRQPKLSDAQRAELADSLLAKPDMDTLWNAITEPTDRAYLLDISTSIFLADGEYSDEEKTLYNDLLNKHLATLDHVATTNEIQKMAELARANSKLDEALYIEEVKKDSVRGISRVELFFYRINKALGYE